MFFGYETNAPRRIAVPLAALHQVSVEPHIAIVSINVRRTQLP